jgi:hypothetical protein
MEGVGIGILPDDMQETGLSLLLGVNQMDGALISCSMAVPGMHFPHGLPDDPIFHFV